jgi:hypothetical protein
VDETLNLLLHFCFRGRKTTQNSSQWQIVTDFKRQGWKVAVQNKFVFTTTCLNVAVIIARILFFTDEISPSTFLESGELTVLKAVSQFFEFAAVGCHIRPSFLVCPQL